MGPQPSESLSEAVTIAPRDAAVVAAPRVHFIEGERPRFADETADLLRQRLSAAALIIFVVLSAAFVGNLLTGEFTLWWLRAAILVVVLACLSRLRSPRPLTLRKLRAFELTVFGATLSQLGLMMVIGLADCARQQETASGVAVEYLYLAAWSVLLLTYGIFMPNTWQRAAAVTVPVACVPYVLLACQRWWSPEVAAMLDADKSGAPIPMTLVAALVAAYGANVVTSARRAVFTARQLGQYRLLEKLGGGGMGIVYRAEHVLLKRPCAVKLIKPGRQADAMAIAQFEKEVRTTAKLTHWNTVEIYDYGHADDGTFYYVMELLPGLSLHDLVARHGPLPPERVVHLLRQVCAALEEAHAIGLIHRDLKPANVFAAERGGIYDVAKVLDFGLVKHRAESALDGAMASAPGAICGTPLYMSPEQASAFDAADARSDIYALGAVAYYLLTGQPPFPEKDVVAIIAAHALEEVVPPSQCKPGIPPDLEQVVLRCLAKRPDDRYQDVRSLGDALAGCACANRWSAKEAALWWQMKR
jgi:serine/threonine-protein kinase